MGIGPGSKIDHYDVVRLLGAGGMGQVWQARDPRLSRDVALKVLRPDGPLDRKRVKRFEQEARAAGAIAHPGIVTVLDLGEYEGYPYVVTELLPGETLRALLKRGSLPPALVVRAGIEIADALRAAHDRGIIHRDLKPENVMALPDGRFKVLDFGIAKLVTPDDDVAIVTSDDRDTATLATDTGAILGTAGYMSPEQVAGEPVDGRSDLFSLGAMLHEMLGGRAAFAGEHSVERMVAVLKQAPASLPPPPIDEPEGLRAIIGRSLAKRREDRFGTAADLAVALRALDVPASSPAHAPILERRRFLIMGAGLVGAAFAGVGYWLGRRRMDVAPASGATSEPSGAPVSVAAGSAPSSRFRRASFKSGTIVSARFLPEGNSFVYGARFEDGELALYTGRLDAVGARAVEVPSADILAVSKSGELALAMSRRVTLWPWEGTLARVSLAGGAPREVAERVYAADFAPDGEGLLVARRAGGKTRLEDPSGRVLFETAGWIGAVRVSPRGDSVAFIHLPRSESDDGDLMLVGIGGGDPRVLVKDWISFQGLAWGAGGDEILFSAVSSAPGEALDCAVHAVTLDGGVRLVLNGPGRLRLHDVARDGAMLVTHDDDRTVTIGRSSRTGPEVNLSSLDTTILFTVSADGKAAVVNEQSHEDKVGYEAQIRGLDGSPAKRLGQGLGWQLSPDGNWVTLAPTQEGPELVLLPVGVGNRKVLTQPGYAYQQAHWFPDGKRLLVLARKPGESPRFCVQDIDSGAIKPLSEPGDWFDSFVMPDGLSVVVLDNAGLLQVIPASGGPPAQTIQLANNEQIGGCNARGEIYLFGRYEPHAKVELLEPKSGRRRPFETITPRHTTGVVEICRFWGTADEKAYAYTYFRRLSTLYVVPPRP